MLSQTDRANIAVSYGVEISTNDYFVLSQSTRLTDGRTDRQTDVDRKTVRMHLQSHGKNSLGIATALDVFFISPPSLPSTPGINVNSLTLL